MSASLFSVLVDLDNHFLHSGDSLCEENRSHKLPGSPLDKGKGI